MAFADPQSVTINAVAQTLARTSSDKNAGAFQKADTTVKLSVSHIYAKGRVRRLLRLDHSKIAADPLMASVNVRLNGAVYLVTDFPETGYTIEEAKQIVDALTLYLTATSGARATQLLGGEN